ncbi:MAG: DUF1573 domain-containing protein [Planctomycetales bacterium]|nr:DUF1573 domain-containing protein [Planctomycetales bacterium]
MSKSVWAIVVAIGIVTSVAAFWIVKSNIVYRPGMTPRGVPRDISEAGLQEVFERVKEETKPAVRPGSQAVADQTQFDFGALEPEDQGKCTFVIQNQGIATLALGDPVFAGLILDAQFTERKIPPGQATTLTVQFKAGTPGEFLEEVKLPTSDPDRASLVFTVRGRVELKLELDPPGIYYPPTPPDVPPGPSETLMFSRVWDSFAIVESSLSMQDAALEIFPASPAELEQHEAKCGYVLRTTMPPGMDSGLHEGTIDLTIQPAGGVQAPLRRQVPVHCKVLRRLGIYGDKIDDRGLIDIGVVPRGQAKKVVLLVRIRDELKELPNVKLEANPSFVQARLLPQSSAGEGDLYSLEITVPADATPCTHLHPTEWGQLTITSDHPRIPSETLPLRLAVVGDN